VGLLDHMADLCLVLRKSHFKSHLVEQNGKRVVEVDKSHFKNQLLANFLKTTHSGLERSLEGEKCLLVSNFKMIFKAKITVVFL
jgi:hypothetical protein